MRAWEQISVFPKHALRFEEYSEHIDELAVLER